MDIQCQKGIGQDTKKKKNSTDWTGLRISTNIYFCYNELYKKGFVTQLRFISLLCLKNSGKICFS